MEEKTIVKLLKIINKLKEDPTYEDFVNLLDRDYFKQYYEIIKKPMSLNEIIKKLQKRKYHSISQVDEDISLIYSNSSKFNGSEHPVTALAYHLKENYQKMKKEVFITISSLVSEYCSLIDQLDDKLRNPPKSINSKEIQVLIQENITKGKVQHSNMKLLQESLKSLTTPDQQLQLLHIIKENEPDYETDLNDITVDIQKLQPDTLTALSNYVESQSGSAMK